jgi:glutathione peroxidase
MTSVHDFILRTIDGEERSLGEYAGKVLLVVNVASQCGLTPQYDGLQRLYERYADRGFEVLAFPCNQFAGQEPGTNAEVKQFCTKKFGATFPLFAKIEVNGEGCDPLYAWLTAQDTRPDGAGDVQWNFAKFVADRSGAAVGRFEPSAEPESKAVVELIEKALA